MENKIYLFHSTMAWRFLEILLVDFYYEKGRILHVYIRYTEQRISSETLAQFNSF